MYQLLSRINFFLFCSSLLFSLNYSTAQIIQNITVDDGLPSNKIRSLYKAQNGIIWCGTDAGLCAYSGRQLLIYDQKDGLPNNNIYHITEDDDGKIWVACYGGGVAYFNGASFISMNEIIPAKQVSTLFFDRGLLLVGTNQQLIIYDGKKCHIEDTTKTNFDLRSLENGISYIFKKDSDVYVITLSNGIKKLVFDGADKTNFHLENVKNDGSTVFGSVNSLDSLVVFKQREFKITGSDRLKKVDFSGQIIKNENSSFDAVVGNEYSIFLLQSFNNQPSSRVIRLRNKNLTTLYENYNVEGLQNLLYDDLNHILWVGTLNKGLYKIFLNDAVTHPLSNIDFKTDGIKILAHNDLNTYYIKEDGIYIQSKEKEVELVCSKNRFIEKLQADSIWKFWMNNNYSEFSLKDIHLNFRTHQFEDEFLWITCDHGLFRLNTLTNSLDYKFLLGIHFYKEDKRFVFQKAFEDVVEYFDVFSKNHPLKYTSQNAPSEVKDIVKFKNKLWYATFQKGLIKDTVGGFISYYKNKQLDESIINKLVNWNDSVLVLAVANGDVYGVEEKEDSLHILFKLESGVDIVGRQIYYLETYKNTLLIGTNRGLVLYDGRDTKFVNHEEGYFMKDVKSTLSLEDGVLISNGKNLIMIDVEKLDYKNDYKIYAKSFHTIDSVYRDSLNHMSTLTFPFDRNYFEIKFSYSNLINPSKDIFSYDLHKKNGEKWIDEKNSFFDPNKLSVWCTNLNPGEYRVRLNAENNFSKKEAHSTYYYFQIIPPFWKTPWFIIIFCLMILGSSIAFVRYLILRAKEKDLINLRISEIRLEALKAQMNPHFTFNIMNSIQNFVLDKNVEKALLYIGNFSKLIRTALDYSNKKSISLSEEIHFLENYVGLQNMRFGEKVHFNLNFPKDYIHKILIPPMIIQPLIENVFVHAFSSESVQPKLDVNIFLKEDISQANTLYIEVKDNGVGRSNEKINTHLSKGLSIIQERLQLINKTNRTSIVLNYRDLKKENAESAGTEVQLQVPLVIS